MSQMETLLKEMEQEAQTTRKMLNSVPDDQYDWKPHPKSMSVRQLATHIAEIPSWVGLVLEHDMVDFAITPYNPVPINNTGELMEYFEKTLIEGKAQLAKAHDGQLNDTWILRNGEDIYSSSSKGESLRHTFCQVVHHRAQLGVYLRLLNIPIPGSYGPSADEMGF